MSNLRNRRNFIKKSAAIGLVGSTAMLQTFGARSAEAADAGGYKALVCVNLKGGMDHADTLIPMDDANFQKLVDVRPGLMQSHNYNDSTSSRNKDNLLGLQVRGSSNLGGREFGLPQEMAELQGMFNEGDAAIVANVGPLIQETNRENMVRVPLPTRLFSHNDQQSTWQTLSTEGARFGWGGAFLNKYNQTNPTAQLMFSAMSASSLDPFLSWSNVRQFRLPSGGKSLGLDIIEKEKYLGNNNRFDVARRMLNDFLAMPNSNENNLLRRDVDSAMERGIENQEIYSGYQSFAPGVNTVFPPSGLAQQLASVAEAISLRDVISAPRQVFYVTLGGFDTHSGQSADLPLNHQQISMALSAFKKAMVELGVWNDVAVFTMSDFGRTLSDNGDGTDHGWGSHQFILGGQVKGGQIFGDVPDPDPRGNQYTEKRARMIPTTSVEQYASGLGRWFGIQDGSLFSQFPNLTNFGPELPDFFNT